MQRFVAAVVSLGMAACLAIGCQRVGAPSGLLEQSIPHAHLTSQKLRALVTDYVPRYAIQVETAADQILAETSDPVIRRNALLWKSQGISACFRAASRPDALAALMDVWILTRQSTLFFEHPAGEPPLGAWQALAVETSQRLEVPLRQMHDTLGSDDHFGERFVDDFARKYPLNSLYFDRASLASEYIESISTPNPELLDVVGGLNENLSDLRKLSALYADFLPKQARWQAELLLIDSVAQPPVAAVVADLAIAARAADRIATTTEAIPALVERERLAGQAIISRERQAAFAEIERMRIDSLTALQAERTAVLAALREERELTGAAIAAVAEKSLLDVDRVVEARAAQIAQDGGVLVDQLYRRALQLALIAAVVVLGVALLWWLRPRPTASPLIVHNAPAAEPRPLRVPERKPPRSAA